MILMASTISKVTYLTAVAVIGGAAFLVYKYLKKAEKPIEQPRPQVRPVVTKEDVNLSGIVKHFKGNMNPLTSVVSDFDKDSASVAFENIYQIVDGHGDEDLHQWANTFFANRDVWTEADYKAKAGIILNLLKQCGISSVQEGTVVWSDGLKDKYNKLMAIENGQSCSVVAPYWMFEGTIFEKGIVIKS